MKQLFLFFVFAAFPLIAGCAFFHDSSNKMDNIQQEYSSGKITDEEIMRIIESGVDINSKSSDGKTLLIFMIQIQNQEMVKYLVDKGADKNIADDQNRTPLYNAIKSFNKKNTQVSFNIIKKVSKWPSVEDNVNSNPAPVKIIVIEIQDNDSFKLNERSKNYQELKKVLDQLVELDKNQHVIIGFKSSMVDKALEILEFCQKAGFREFYVISLGDEFFENSVSVD